MASDCLWSGSAQQYLWSGSNACGLVVHSNIYVVSVHDGQGGMPSLYMDSGSVAQNNRHWHGTMMQRQTDSLAWFLEAAALEYEFPYICKIAV